MENFSILTINLLLMVAILVEVKCDWLETYSQCLSKFKNKETVIVAKSLISPNTFVSLNE